MGRQWRQDGGSADQSGSAYGANSNGYGAGSANSPSSHPGAGNPSGAQSRGSLSDRMGAGQGAPTGGSLGSRMYPANTPPTGSIAGGSGGPNLLRAREGQLYHIQSLVQKALIDELDAKLDRTDVEKIRKTIEDLLTRVLEQQGMILNRSDRLAVLDSISDEILGLGPIEPLLRDDAIDEICLLYTSPSPRD